MKCAIHVCNRIAVKTVAFKGIFGDEANIPVCNECSAMSCFEKFHKIELTTTDSKNGGMI